MVTATRCVEHEGHSCVPPERLAITFDSLRMVLEAVLRDARIAVRHGQRGIQSLRHQLAERYVSTLKSVCFWILVRWFGHT